MKFTKLLLISFFITLVLAFVPLQRKTLTGTECPDPAPNGLCYEDLPSYGLPLPTVMTTPLDSPASISWERDDIMSFVLAFPFNWIIVLIVLKIAVVIYKKGIKR